MRKALSVVVVLSLLLVMASSSTMAAKYTLRAAHQLAESFAWQDGLEYFADKVKEYSDGEAEVLVYGNAVLGQEQDYIQNMMQGVLDFAICAPAWGATFAPELDFLSLPFLFKNREHWKAALDGEIGATMAQFAEDATGLKVMGYWGGSSRNVLSRVGAINGSDDFKGFKLRVMASPIQVDTWKAVGASPTPMAYKEVYSALQQGVIDGMENELATIYSMKFYEVANNISLTGHTYTVRPLWMSGKTWDRLPKNIQDAITKAAKEATEFARNLEWEQGDEALQKMVDKYGVEVNEIDPAFKTKMMNQTAPVREKVAEDLGVTDLYNKLNALAKLY